MLVWGEGKRGRERRNIPERYSRFTWLRDAHGCISTPYSLARRWWLLWPTSVSGNKPPPTRAGSSPPSFIQTRRPLTCTLFQREDIIGGLLLFFVRCPPRDGNWFDSFDPNVSREWNEKRRDDDFEYISRRKGKRKRKRGKEKRYAGDGNGITRPDSKSAIDKHSKQFKGNIVDSIAHSANVGRKRTSKSTVKAESGTAAGLKASFGN